MNKLKELRKQARMSQKEFAALFGIAQNTLSQYENHKREPDLAFLQQVADHFSVSLDLLVGRTADASTLAESGTPVPIVASVHAGWNYLAESSIEGYEPVYGRPHPEQYVWMTVCGDSMEPYLLDGDLILVRRQNTAENGDLVVAVLEDDEGTVKKFQRDESGIHLIPLNPKYPYRFLSPEAAERLYIYGIVVESKRKFC